MTAERDQTAAWIEYQRKGALEVSTKDAIELNAVKRVIGLDIEWISDTTGLCVAADMPYPLNEVSPIYTSHRHVTNVPYMPGFLGFREVDAYQHVLQHVTPIDKKEVVIFVDGNGVLHPRFFGSASHLGVVTGLSTIGVAKHLHQCVQKSEKEIKAEMKEKKLLEYDLFSQESSPRLLGRAIRLNEHITNPIYVSVGHNIALDTACEIVKRCMRYRIPEPTRLADIEAHRLSQLLSGDE